MLLGPLLLPHVITVYRIYVKGTVPDVYTAGNCDNVVLAFPRWGRGSIYREICYVWALISEVGTTRHRGMSL